MDISVMLQNLRDPMGVPFYPIVFQGLSVITFALHIFFVNIVLGSTIVAIWGHYSAKEQWQRLSRTLARATTINISVAIVLGVAPLLFVQVIYDPFWYTSNVLSAWWTMIFLASLIVGALAMYVFYLKRKKSPRSFGAFGVISLVCILLAAFIIHALSMQALHPEQWLNWAFQGAQMKTGGWGLNAYSISRLLHFLIPAILNTGLFLMLYAWFFSTREDKNQEELQEVAALGLKMARYAALVAAVVGVWWLLTLPGDLNFYTDHSLMLGIVLAVVLIVLLFKAGSHPIRFAIPATLVSFVTVFVMTISRETLRVAYLGQFDYSASAYPVSIDWASTILFLVTFVLGLLVLAYLLKIAFVSGRYKLVNRAEAP